MHTLTICCLGQQPTFLGGTFEGAKIDRLGNAFITFHHHKDTRRKT